MRLLIAVVLCLVFGSSARAQSDDEAWIERYMDDRGARLPTGVAPIGRGDRIQPADLPRFVGYGARLTLANGRIRAGVIERVDAKGVLLRAYVSGGEASLTLAREQIVAVELE